VGARRVADRRAAVRAYQSTAVAFGPRAPAGSLAARLTATISEARTACQGQPDRVERSEPRSGGLDRTPQRSYRSRRTLPPTERLTSSFVPHPSMPLANSATMPETSGAQHPSCGLGIGRSDAGPSAVRCRARPVAPRSVTAA
jgi:hypothetical protein